MRRTGFTLIAALLCVLAAAAPAAGRTFNDVADGDWTNRDVWDEKKAHYPAVGGDAAIIDSHKVHVNVNPARYVRIILGGGSLLKGGPDRTGFRADGAITVTAPSIIGNPQKFDRGRRMLTLGGRITGKHTLTKIGPGCVLLYGSSPSFTGDWEVKEGILNAFADGALGRGTVTVARGAQLWVAGVNARQTAGRAPKEVIINGGTFRINGSYGTAEVYGWKFTMNGGTFLLDPNDADSRSVGVHSSEVYIRQAATIRGTYSRYSPSTFKANLHGTAPLTIVGFTGQGRLQFWGNNRGFSGDLTVAAGRITIMKRESLGTGDIVVKGGAGLALAASDATHRDTRLRLERARKGGPAKLDLYRKTVNEVGALHVDGRDGKGGWWVNPGNYTQDDLPGYIVGDGVLRVRGGPEPI